MGGAGQGGLVEEPALPFQAWKRHLPHPHQQQHTAAPPPDPADEVSAAVGDGDPVVPGSRGRG